MTRLIICSYILYKFLFNSSTIVHDYEDSLVSDDEYLANQYDDIKADPDQVLQLLNDEGYAQDELDYKGDFFEGKC